MKIVYSILDELSNFAWKHNLPLRYKLDDLAFKAFRIAYQKGN